MTYAQLNLLLVGRNKDKKKLANNTYAERRDVGIAIRLHQTDILTFYPCGSVVVKTGGWETVTTKGRINRYLPPPWIVLQKDWEWLRWNYRNPTIAPLPFHEGDCITGKGELIRAEP